MSQLVDLSLRANIDARPDTKGLYQPILARPCPDEPGAYQVGDGHHRWAAAGMLLNGDGSDEFPGDPRWGQAPVVVEAIDDRDMLLMAIDTALNHKGLSPIDEASAFQALRDAGLNDTEIAERYGRSRSSVANIVRLLKLPKSIRQLIGQGVLTERHGRALLPLAKVPGLLRGKAAQHGKDLWTTESEHGRGRGDLLPGTKSLWVLNVGQVEANVTFVLNNHTRALLGSKEACHEAGLPRSHATPWPLDWDIAADTPRLLPISVVTEMPADHHGGPCAKCPFAIKLKQRDEHLTCTNEPCTYRCHRRHQAIAHIVPSATSGLIA
jgi:ParB/RepB/Spo0J family partition protein